MKKWYTVPALAGILTLGTAAAVEASPRRLRRPKRRRPTTTAATRRACGACSVSPDWPALPGSSVVTTSPVTTSATSQPRAPADAAIAPPPPRLTPISGHDVNGNAPKPNADD